ncbi:hypothetical protein [Prochlorothrix hollandica]|uniref:hypothetical protein n=1 Tax=Prochlorothrix hollandica TaxID=1223 RepID=UPI001CECEB28|nr:hypothetical protein [Prochlorothrix hollandica]
MGEGLFHLGRFPDLGRGNPPVVAPAVGPQEGRPGGENPTRGRGFPSKLNSLIQGSHLLFIFSLL